MSGILDSKTRVMDTILTGEGRSQLASGQMEIAYVSLTDATAYYAADLASGSQDATLRIYLEACSLPQDQITFQADVSGHVSSLSSRSGVRMSDGRVLTTTSSGTLEGTSFLSGKEFQQYASAILSSSLDNFNSLYAIGTYDTLFNDNEFGVGPDNVQFIIHENRPIQDSNNFSAHLDHLESVFFDPRFSNVPNFKFLPPLNKHYDKSVDKSDPTNTSDHQLGHYRPMGRTFSRALQSHEIEYELKHFERMGYSTNVTFEPTSRNNRLIGQFFEVTNDTMTKLDVINYGIYSNKHYFFAGKQMQDNNGTDTFVHLFTLVFG